MSMRIPRTDPTWRTFERHRTRIPSPPLVQADLYTVPAGKLLEIQYLHLTTTYPAVQDIPYFSLYATGWRD
jgi:hypothetical protein